MQPPSNSSLDSTPLRIKYFIAKNAAAILTVTCLIVAVGLESRAFFVGYIAALSFLFFQGRVVSFNRKNKLLAAFSILLLFFIAAFFIKTDSSAGRMLVYKISTRMLKENFVKGVGFGNFGQAYGYYQADYFKEGDFTQKELLLADNTKHAFNDYLQLTIETGVAGIIVLTLLGIFLITIVRRALTGHHTSPILQLAVAQMIAVGTSAVFTHVFEHPLFSSVFFCSSVVVLYYGRWSGRRTGIFFGLLLAGTAGILWISYGDRISRTRYYNQYEEAREFIRAGIREKALPILEDIYPYMSKDINFLHDYANTQIYFGNYTEAIPVLRKLISISNTSYFHLELANCYYKTHQLREAEAAYQLAVYMVPNRFTSRYYLFEFYQRTGRREEALQTGTGILKLPVKIPSLQVNVIKEAVRKDMIPLREGR
jgi:tetratricopeptide (TPR) repeat protein